MPLDFGSGKPCGCGSGFIEVSSKAPGSVERTNEDCTGDWFQKLLGKHIDIDIPSFANFFWTTRSGEHLHGEPSAAGGVEHKQNTSMPTDVAGNFSFPRTHAFPYMV